MFGFIRWTKGRSTLWELGKKRAGEGGFRRGEVAGEDGVRDVGGQRLRMRTGPWVESLPFAEDFAGHFSGWEDSIRLRRTVSTGGYTRECFCQ